MVLNEKIGDIVLRENRCKNVYMVEVSSLPQDYFTCLNALNDDFMSWHKRLGHASLSLLNKLVAKDLVVGLPSINFNDDKVCDVCDKGKHVEHHSSRRNM